MITVGVQVLGQSLWLQPEHPTWTGLAICGVVIGLFTAGLLIYFFYLPTRTESAKLTRRLNRKDEAWVDRLAHDPHHPKLAAGDRKLMVLHLASSDRGLRRKAAEVLRRKGGAEAVEEVKQQMLKGWDPDAVADAIASARWTEMEPALLDLVGRKHEIAAAAVTALGEVGGNAALDTLLDVTGRPDLGDARDRAINRLRERLRSENAGQVSLAADADAAGALSIPKE